MGDAEAAALIQHDHAAVAVEAALEILYGFYGDGVRRASDTDFVGGPFGQHQFHDGLTPSGAGGGGAEIIGIAAAADQRRVAHAPRILVERAAGGGAGSDVSRRIQRDRAHGVMAGLGAGKGEVGFAGGLFFLRFLQAADLALNHQVFITAELHSELLGEPLRALADEINVRAFIQDQARGPDGIADVLHAAHAAGAKRGPVHHEGIELHAAVAGEKAAAAGVKSLIVFHAGDGGFHGVQRRAAAFQHMPALGQRFLHSGDVGLHHVIRNGPGAAMDHEYGKLSQVCAPGVTSECNRAEPGAF